MATATFAESTTPAARMPTPPPPPPPEGAGREIGSERVAACTLC